MFFQFMWRSFYFLLSYHSFSADGLGPNALTSWEEDMHMHVFHLDAGPGGEGEEKPERKSDIIRVELTRAAGLVASSDRPLEVRAKPGRPGSRR